MAATEQALERVDRTARSCRACRHRGSTGSCRARAARPFRRRCRAAKQKRRSTVRPWVATWMRPSCGRRRSAMSRLAMTFRRETIAGCSSTRGVMTSYSTPSMRSRMRAAVARDLDVDVAGAVADRALDHGVDQVDDRAGAGHLVDLRVVVGNLVARSVPGRSPRVWTKSGRVAAVGFVAQALGCRPAARPRCGCAAGARRAFRRCCGSPAVRRWPRVSVSSHLEQRQHVQAPRDIAFEQRQRRPGRTGRRAAAHTAGPAGRPAPGTAPLR